MKKISCLKRNLNKKELKDAIQKYGDPDDSYQEWNKRIKHEDISLTITQEIVSKMMEKTVDEMGKALFPNLPEERP